MWVRLRFQDLRIISHYVGLFVIGIGFAMLVPLVTAIACREWDACSRLRARHRRRVRSG